VSLLRVCDRDGRSLTQVDASVGVRAELDVVTRVQDPGGLAGLRGVAVDHHALGVQARVTALDHAPRCGALAGRRAS